MENGYKSSIKEACAGFVFPEGLEHAIESMAHGLAMKRERKENVSIFSKTSIGYFEEIDFGDGKLFDGWFVQVLTTHTEDPENVEHHETFSRLYVTKNNVLTGQLLDLDDVKLVEPEAEPEPVSDRTFAMATEPPKRWLH